MVDDSKKDESSGDFVGRDKNISAGSGSVVIGGNVSGSTIVTGDHNKLTAQSDAFQIIYRTIEKRADISKTDKADLKAEVQEVETEIKKGDQADESFLTRRLRNIKRIAPDILDVILTTLASPAAGFGMIVKKVVEKMSASTTE